MELMRKRSLCHQLGFPPCYHGSALFIKQSSLRTVIPTLTPSAP